MTIKRTKRMISLPQAMTQMSRSERVVDLTSNSRPSSTQPKPTAPTTRQSPTDLFGRQVSQVSPSQSTPFIRYTSPIQPTRVSSQPKQQKQKQTPPPPPPHPKPHTSAKPIHYAQPVEPVHVSRTDHFTQTAHPPEPPIRVIPERLLQQEQPQRYPTQPGTIYTHQIPMSEPVYYNGYTSPITMPTNMTYQAQTVRPSYSAQPIHFTQTSQPRKTKVVTQTVPHAGPDIQNQLDQLRQQLSIISEQIESLKLTCHHESVNLSHSSNGYSNIMRQDFVCEDDQHLVEEEDDIEEERDILADVSCASREYLLKHKML